MDTLAKIYVDPNGNDENQGTQDSPFKTIQKATEYLYHRGGEIIIRGGIHQINNRIWIGSGPNATGLKISAYPGEKPVLDGQFLKERGPLLNIKDTDNITIQGLEIRSVAGHGIEVINGENITLLENTVHHVDGMGIRVRGYLADIPGEEETTEKSRHIVIRNNTVYQTNLSNAGAKKGSANWGAGIQVFNTHNVIVEQNRVSSNYGEGIGLTLVEGGVVSKNRLESNYSVQLYLDNASQIRVNSNTIVQGDDPRFWRDGFPATGLSLANEYHRLSSDDSPERYYLNQLEIYNNTIIGGTHAMTYGTWAGIHSGLQHHAKGLRNSLIANNILYGAKSELIRFDADSQSANVKLSQNRLVPISQDTFVKISDPDAFQFESNYFDFDLAQSAGTLAGALTLENEIALSWGEDGLSPILGETWSDRLTGDNNANIMASGAGNDTLIGAAGDDTVLAGTGNDLARGQSGNDQIWGEAGADTLVGHRGADTLAGGSGSDRLIGGYDHDLLLGGSGDDWLFGRYDNDTLMGETGDDRLRGASGDDTLFGGKGNDHLLGGDGNDILVGSDFDSSFDQEIDSLRGGQGSDKFIIGHSAQSFYTAEPTAGNESYVKILDFQSVEGDHIQLHGSAAEYSLRPGTSAHRTSASLYQLTTEGSNLVAKIYTTEALDLNSDQFIYHNSHTI